MVVLKDRCVQHILAHCRNQLRHEAAEGARLKQRGFDDGKISDIV
jgi:hypothetical protein